VENGIRAKWMEMGKPFFCISVFMPRFALFLFSSYIFPNHRYKARTRLNFWSRTKAQSESTAGNELSNLLMGDSGDRLFHVSFTNQA
jgi:hypothetical protein